MDTGALLGTIGIIVGAVAILMAVLWRVQEVSAAIRGVEARQDSFVGRQDKFLDLARSLVNEQRQLLSRFPSWPPQIPPSLQLNISFIQKMLAYRSEKLLIARRIANKYIQDSETILLDSGSTTDTVPSELPAAGKVDVLVHSNNILAAMHLAGRQTRFKLLPGDFDDQFAAVYSTAGNQKARDDDFDSYIIAAVRLRLSRGIMVRRDDKQNNEFKAAMLRGFERLESSRLIIAVDPSKFVLADDDFDQVLPDDWERIRTKASGRITVITAPVPSDFSREERDAFETQVRLFEDAGIAVDRGDNPDSKSR